MTKISTEDVRKVANLARLELPEEKIKTYTDQLEKILDLKHYVILQISLPLRVPEGAMP